MAEPTHIRIRNAREHNLKGVDLDIPRNALVVFTGVSGCGKSSLAHDTVFKEGQRRFLESLSSYARQFLGQMERPKADLVDGLSPTLAIDQKTVNRNPRSTVGTVTEVYDHLRLLLARLGTPHCPVCGREIRKIGVEAVVDSVLARGAGRAVQVLGPIVRERKGEYRKELDDLQRDGWVRVRIDGKAHTLGDPIELARYEKHTIEVVVDRLKPSVADRTRLAEAVEGALRLGKGLCTTLIDDEELTWSTDRSCPDHPEVSVPELEPRMFSFNAPQGACGTCTGLGHLVAFDPALIVDDSVPIVDAYRAFNEDGKIPFGDFARDNLVDVVKRLGQDPRSTLKEWPPEARERLLRGDSTITYRSIVDRDGRKEVRDHEWRGLIGIVELIWRWTSYGGFEKLQRTSPCPTCRGRRLNPVSLAVTFREKNIHGLSTMSVDESAAFFEGLVLNSDERLVGSLLLQELLGRLVFLREVGLGYLSLDRAANTLSGGEAQRIRLASQVGSGLQGVTYVLDEPSIGLHPRDNDRLLAAMRALRDRGNSVLVVEHDHDTILAADHVVDVGPGAGRDGGELIVSGTPGKLLRSESLTAKYLRGELSVGIPEERRPTKGPQLEIIGARSHNLSGVDVKIPLGCLVVVTGVSGSGKSSLVFGCLDQSVRSILEKGGPVACAEVRGVENVDKLVHIGQLPIGRTPRSNPGTYTKAFDLIRELLASTPEAKARGYKPGRFSFNVKGGRCEDCEGAGVKLIEMQFLPPVAVTCETCQGRRFSPETLEITWKGKNVREILDATISTCRQLFQDVPKLGRILGTLEDVGLGYVSLGQSSTTLSGGEAQRVKLATELHRPSTGKTLYLLDEPTTGLHSHDVVRLVASLQRLVDAGNTVVVVEHNTDVILCADHLVDLGPEGGTGGGKIVGVGPPEVIARLDTPTGRALAKLIGAAAPVGLAAERPLSFLAPDRLRLKGVRTHNLQDVDVSIPHGKMTVVTGPSGSGKSSLAFDTIFAEGQRRYVESLSTYARRFLGRLDRAPLDRVEGLKPAIAIDQASASHNPRSTVGTITEIHDVLRVLYARVGEPHCPVCDAPLVARQASVAAKHLRETASGTGWLVTRLRTAASPAERRGALVRDGWTRLLQSRDERLEVALDDPAAEGLLALGALLVIDRLAPAKTDGARLQEAIQKGYDVGDDLVWFVPRDGAPWIELSAKARCADHGAFEISHLTPRHFSFNHRVGACPACEGLGTKRQLVREALFPQPAKGLWEALDPKVAAVAGRSTRTRALMVQVLEAFDAGEATPVKDWSPALAEAVLYGAEGTFALRWSSQWGKMQRVVDEERPWTGLQSMLEAWSARLPNLFAESPCRACGGGRLRPELLAVKLEGVGIGTLGAMPVGEAHAVVSGWRFEGARAEIAGRALEELARRLSFLVDVGLDYLGLDRSAGTLSGGEAQRIRLASQLGSGLTDVIYVLDEPTIGLHPKDTERLLKSILGLRDLGNTLVVVEHDPETIRAADHVIDLGPGAGNEGGRVMAVGSPPELSLDPSSPTGRWLSGKERFPARKSRRKPRSWIHLDGATGHTLKDVDAAVPTGIWVGFSGPSGSGKSTLVMDTLAPALRKAAGEKDLEPSAPHRALRVGEKIDQVVLVDQSPIGRSPRSTPATYTGVLDKLRALFAETPGAKERGWGPGRFSFNADGGRCAICEGRGRMLVEMHFLPDVWVVCESCRGQRYGAETLQVRWQGRSIADVLAMRADEALALLKNQRAIARQLQALVDVGLGYLPLGQPGDTLSGGEAQRVKLAAELTSKKGHCVYILDEPTTGLHLSDVAKLIEVLHRLVDQGHTMITIEHHLDVLAQCDWLIDLGPGGGGAGGRIVAAGTPEDLARSGSPTGQCLRAPGRRAG